MSDDDIKVINFNNQEECDSIPVDRRDYERIYMKYQNMHDEAQNCNKSSKCSNTENMVDKDNKEFDNSQSNKDPLETILSALSAIVACNIFLVIAISVLIGLMIAFMYTNNSMIIETIVHEYSESKQNEQSTDNDNQEYDTVNQEKDNDSNLSDEYQQNGIMLPSDDDTVIGVKVAPTSIIDNNGKIESAIYIVNVMDGSPADTAGLQKGDIIAYVDNIKVNSINGLHQLLNNCNAGDIVTISVYDITNTAEIIDHDVKVVTYGELKDIYNNADKYYDNKH